MQKLNVIFALVMATYLHGCDRNPQIPAPKPKPPAISLSSARQGFQTRFLPPKPAAEEDHSPPDEPPPRLYLRVRYSSPAGQLAAYLSPDPKDGRRHPAVLWCHGGFGGIGAYYYQRQPAANDQTPRAFRESDFVVMLPSWRGENDNPGRFEMFYGEVDDALAAIDYLRALPYVDPARIYVVGHSTGGTVALLAAEMAGDKVRAAFSFGGAPDVARIVGDGKGWGNTPFDYRDQQEVRLRSAIHFVGALKPPTWYFEGENSAYVPDAREMDRIAAESGAPFHVSIVSGGTHYNILRPLTNLLADKLRADTGLACNVVVTQAEVDTAFANRPSPNPTPARQPIVQLTQAAQAKVIEDLQQDKLDPRKMYLRVTMDASGYPHLQIDRDADSEDLLSTSGFVRVVTDKSTSERARGLIVDYQTGPDGGGGFSFRRAR
jgi:dienelactone hydrolase/Fe-S cluster assembly iron-binding protein IscA